MSSSKQTQNLNFPNSRLLGAKPQLRVGRLASASGGLFHCFIEDAEVDRNAINISGWAFHEQKTIFRAEGLVLDCEPPSTTPLHYGEARRDIGDRWRLPTAYQSGFHLAFHAASSFCVILLRFGLEDGELVELSLEVSSVAPARVTANRAPRMKVILRRMLNSFRYLSRGDLRGLARGIAEVWKGKQGNQQARYERSVKPLPA